MVRVPKMLKMKACHMVCAMYREFQQMQIRGAGL